MAKKIGKKVLGSHPRRSPKRKRLSQANDTLVHSAMIIHAIDAIEHRRTIDCQHDIPYLAGYSQDGQTIYIDRHLPKSFKCRGQRIPINRFLVLHEAVEKAMIDVLGLHYQHAHQIALRVEEAAVRAAGVPWREYDRFMQKFIKEVGDEDLSALPVDLDVKPYRDEHDTQLLKRMIQRKKEALGLVKPGQEPGMGPAEASAVVAPGK